MRACAVGYLYVCMGDLCSDFARGEGSLLWESLGEIVDGDFGGIMIVGVQGRREDEIEEMKK